MTKSKQISPSKLALGMIGAAMVPAAATAEETGAGITLSFDAGIGTGDASNRIFENKLGTDDFNEFSTDTAFVGSVGASGCDQQYVGLENCLFHAPNIPTTFLALTMSSMATLPALKWKKAAQHITQLLAAPSKQPEPAHAWGLGLAYGSSTETADKRRRLLRQRR